MDARRGLLPTSVLRLSALYVLVFSLAASGLVGLLYVSAVRALDRETDDVIAAELQGLADQYQTAGTEGLAALIGERVRMGGSSGDVYLLVDRELRPIAGNLAGWPAPGDPAQRWMEFDVSAARGSGIEARHVRAGIFALPDGDRLLVGTDIHEREAFKSRIAWTLLLSVGAIILVGASLGAWMNRQVLRRVGAISSAAREIVDGNFSRRLPMDASGDEFDALSANLNEMLERVEQLTDALRYVMDSTAHDLRGPLNRLRARVESGLRNLGRDPDPSALEGALKDADALGRTLDALLRIAQAQGGPATAEFGPVDLAQLATEIQELYEPVARERGVDLRIPVGPSAIVRGSRQLLAHALANLVDNALKFTPRGGSVEIAVHRESDGTMLSVADTGPGIPANDRARALVRGVRLATADQPLGSGLGLSLVAAVARMHHARLELTDNRPGLCVELHFPASDGRSPARPRPAGSSFANRHERAL